MKVKTILGRIYYIIVAVCVFLHVVILSLSFFDNKHQEKYCRSIIPDREYQTDEDNRRFVFSAREFDTLKSKKVPQSLEIGLFFYQIFIFII